MRFNGCTFELSWSVSRGRKPGQTVWISQVAQSIGPPSGPRRCSPKECRAVRLAPGWLQELAESVSTARWSAFGAPLLICVFVCLLLVYFICLSRLNLLAAVKLMWTCCLPIQPTPCAGTRGHNRKLDRAGKEDWNRSV